MNNLYKKKHLGKSVQGFAPLFYIIPSLSIYLLIYKPPSLYRSVVKKNFVKVYILSSTDTVFMGHLTVSWHEKFRSDRFSSLDLYLIQTNIQQIYYRSNIITMYNRWQQRTGVYKLYVTIYCTRIYFYRWCKN